MKTRNEENIKKYQNDKLLKILASEIIALKIDTAKVKKDIKGGVNNGTL